MTTYFPRFGCRNEPRLQEEGVDAEFRGRGLEAGAGCKNRGEVEGVWDNPLLLGSGGIGCGGLVVAEHAEG
jgi:hypothetical protein